MSRSAKSSTSSPPVAELSTMHDESSVFYHSGADGPSSSSGIPNEVQDMYSDLYDDIHNKLNWLTVCSNIIHIFMVKMVVAWFH